ncbi:polymer-forming cytoskeletal protein [candidate division KSB1 bacterium]|nr:polymer-forming cytoskeletal protein [candidate division KSB1 bacterium]
MLNKKDEQSGEILTWLGKDSQFEGRLSLKHSLRIDGKLKGRLDTTDSLTVGRGGEIEGEEIRVKNAVIGGTVIGKIVASGKITLEASSIFRGEMNTKKLVIHDGAVFEGRCSMSDEISPNTASGPTLPRPTAFKPVETEISKPQKNTN